MFREWSSVPIPIKNFVKNYFKLILGNFIVIYSLWTIYVYICDYIRIYYIEPGIELKLCGGKCEIFEYEEPYDSPFADQEALQWRQEVLKSINCTNKKIEYLNRRFGDIQRTPDSNCDTPHVRIMDLGRLGNQVCDLMSLWIFRKQFGMRISISIESYEYYSNLFSEISVPHGFNNCFEVEDPEKNNASYAEMYQRFNESLHWIKIGKPLLSENIQYYNYITGHPCVTDFIIPYRDEIRSLFVFKPEIIERAKRRVYSALVQKNIIMSNMTLVSVHVRRTDYMEYLSNFFETFVPGKIYYEKAFDLYRRRFKSAVFVVMSDDILWCKKYLDDRDVIFIDDSSISDPSLDFTTIAQCHHHIIGFGTFGLTSALLGRGNIAYDISFSNWPVIQNYTCADPEVFIPII